MTIQEILNNVDKAVNTLIQQEKNILLRRLSERIISSHLANYLIPLFPEYNVDPEYNGDIDKPNDRKALHIAKRRIKEIGFKLKKKDNYLISPDIIIHRRNSNDHNLVVIEVKKDSSNANHKKYDLIKLEHLTIDYMGNHYDYRIGVAIIFGTKRKTGEVVQAYFQAGLPVSKQALV